MPVYTRSQTKKSHESLEQLTKLIEEWVVRYETLGVLSWGTTGRDEVRRSYYEGLRTKLFNILEARETASEILWSAHEKWQVDIFITRARESLSYLRAKCGFRGYETIF